MIMNKSTAIFAGGMGMPYQPPQTMQCSLSTQKAAIARNKLTKVYSLTMTGYNRTEKPAYGPSRDSSGLCTQR